MHWYLFPFMLLYGLVVNLRNKFFDWGIYTSKSYDIPVISVGNLTVGGTGKTPHTEFLINWLGSRYRLVSLSRGYKRKTKGFYEVKTQSSASDAGDEALQIKQKFPNVRVVVDEKRVHAIDKLLSEDVPPEVILLDDAYQHRYVNPGINILLMDYHRLITNDWLLPVGRLREPAHNSHRASIVVVTKCPHHLTPIDFRILQKELNLFPYQDLFFTTFQYGAMLPVFDNQAGNLDLTQLNNMQVLTLTGIANTDLFFKKLKQHGAELHHASFADHHDFSASDIEKTVQKFDALAGSHKAIVCTEKDAVRLKTGTYAEKLKHLPVYYLPIEVRFMNEGEANFKAIISKYLRRYYGN